MFKNYKNSTKQHFESSIKDFIKEEDKQYPNTYVWIYETTYGSKYYIKFKFKNEGNIVVFISFHEALY